MQDVSKRTKGYFELWKSAQVAEQENVDFDNISKLPNTLKLCMRSKFSLKFTDRMKLFFLLIKRK